LEYAKSIYDAIYDVYLDEYNKKKEEIMKEHEEKLKSKISFFGNNILLNAFEKLEEDFAESNFIVNKEMDYNLLKQELENRIQNNSITHKIVIAFDKNVRINHEEYKELIEMCNEQEIYILIVTEEILNLSYENVTIINFYEQLKNHNEYLMVDKIHLTEEGNLALIKILTDVIKQEG